MKRYYDEDSIPENRLALLSDRQKKLLWWDIAQSLFLNTVILLFILGVGRGTPLFVIIAPIAIVLHLYFTITAVVKNYRDISGSSLYMLTGEIVKNVRLGSNPMKCYIEIENHPPLEVPASFYKELLNKSRYRLFITENSQQVVNFESLTPDIETRDHPFDWRLWVYLVITKYIPFGVFLLLVASLITYGLRR